jgi:hypothetical protein
MQALDGLGEQQAKRIVWRGSNTPVGQATLSIVTTWRRNRACKPQWLALLRGHIGLQAHHSGSRVQFRNIRIRRF